MQLVDALIPTVLVAACAAAIWFDVRENRIPNALTLGALAVALALRAVGPGSLGDGLAGAGVAFAIGLPFFLVGGLGGGDVKLLTAIGALVGLDRIFAALFWTAVVGGAMGIFMMLRKKAVPQTMANLRTIFMTFGRGTFTGWRRDGESRAAVTLDTPGAVTIPYGVAIAAGALVAWFAM